MPGGASLALSFLNVTTSQILVQAGVTTLPDGISGTKVPSISGLAGWDIIEPTGGATAHVQLFDGPDATSTMIGDISLSAGGQSGPPPTNPIQVFRNAIYLKVISGTVEGNIQYLL